MPGSKRIQHYRELDVYRKAFDAAMVIFTITKTFPLEEKYSLVKSDDCRVRFCSNLAEAWRKRRYPAVFKNKLTDAMQEASETQSWLQFALACGYIEEDSFNKVDREYESILAMLNSMEKSHEKFCF